MYIQGEVGGGACGGAEVMIGGGDVTVTTKDLVEGVGGVELCVCGVERVKIDIMREVCFVGGNLRGRLCV